MADNLPRVGLIGGNGTGKTLMLETFATKIAKIFPNENVIFAIQQLYNTKTFPVKHERYYITQKRFW